MDALQEEEASFDIYNIEITEEYLDDDEISPAEEGFMAGYLDS